MAIFTWNVLASPWKSVNSDDKDGGPWPDVISVTLSDEMEEGGDVMFPPTLEKIEHEIQGLTDQDDSDEDNNDTSDIDGMTDKIDVDPNRLKEYIIFKETKGIGTASGSFEVSVPEGLVEVFPIRKLSYAQGEAEKRTTNTVHSFKDVPSGAGVYEYIPYPKNVRYVTIKSTAYASDGTSDTNLAVIEVTHNYDIGANALKEKLQEYSEAEKKRVEQEQNSSSSGSGNAGSGDSSSSGSTGGDNTSSGSSSSGGSSSASNGGPAATAGGGGFGASYEVTVSTGHEGFPPTASIGPYASSTVLINGKPALMATASGTHFKTHKRKKNKVHPSEIRYDTVGHPMVLIDNLPAVTIGDGMADGDTVATGSSDVLIG